MRRVYVPSTISHSFFSRLIATMTVTIPRRFAPLAHNSGQQHTHLPKLQGVIFDVDGTLWYEDPTYMCPCLGVSSCRGDKRVVAGFNKTTLIRHS